MIKQDVIAIGSTVRDAFFKTSFEIVNWPKASSGKAIIIPFGEKFGAEDVYFTLGGNAANASITFARQGLKTGIFTKVGKDVSAEEIRRVWRKEKVDARLVETSNLPTGYSVLLLQGGERSIITYHGAIDEFTLRGVNLNNLKSNWWYVSLPGESYKTFDRLLAFANKNNIKVALNPSFKHLTGRGRAKLLKHLKSISFLSVNGQEASLITGVPLSQEKKVFQKLDEFVPGVVAITYGPNGSSVSDGKYIYKTKTFKNKKLIDRTGAGDAFGSGFVAGLIQKKEKFVGGLPKPENVEYAIRLATANATSVVEHLGASEGTITKREFQSGRRFSTLNISRKELK